MITRVTTRSSTQPDAGPRGPAAIVALVALLLTALGAPAHGAPPEDRGGQVPATAFEQAERDGLARVLVTLEVDVRPEGPLTGPQRGRQRQDIRAAQRRTQRSLPDDGSRVERDYRSIGALAATVTTDGLRALAKHPDVVRVTLDHLLTPTEASPALVDSVPHTEATGLHLDGADGSGAAVAILDTGVDADHPAFGGRVVAEACFSRGRDRETSTGGDCPDDEAVMHGPGSAAPLRIDGVADAHGTHVAGIAAGQATEAPELGDGVAPGADIVAIQVFHHTDDGASAWFSDILAGLDWLVDEGEALSVAAANLSLGAGLFDSEATCTAQHPDMADVVGHLASNGIATVAASGNAKETGKLSAPACVEGVIAVGATDTAAAEHEVAWFSNQAEFLDLMAPGMGIRAAVPDDGARAESGTSMATPHVAGGLVLLRQATGISDVDELLAALVQTGVDVPDRRTGDAEPPAYPDIRLAAARDHLVGALHGTVTSSATDDPLEAASVTVAEETTTTDADGRYRFADLEPGDHTLTAELAGYHDTETIVALVEGESTTVDLALEPRTPGVPQHLEASASAEEVHLTWEAPDGDALVDEYVVERDELHLWTGTPLEFTDDEVTAEASYSYAVAAVGPGGTGEPATVSVTVPEEPQPDDGTDDGTGSGPAPAPAPEPEDESETETDEAPEPEEQASEPEPEEGTAEPVPDDEETSDPEPVTFSDVHEDDVHAEAIGRMAARGVIEGYTDGTFRPGNQVTRAQMASLLVRALDLPATSTTGTFSDVGEEFAHARAIETAAAAGIITGYGDGTFRPQQSLDRAQAATMLVRAFELTSGATSSPFSDVAPGPPHGDNIITAAEHDLVRGYPDDTFRPSVELTRAQVASMLDRVLTR